MIQNFQTNFLRITNRLKSLESSADRIAGLLISSDDEGERQRLYSRLEEMELEINLLREQAVGVI